jgi:excisionase family DNA binding protein
VSLEEALRDVFRQELRSIVQEVRAAVEGSRAKAPDDESYLSVQRAASVADVHPDTIRKWINSGRLPRHKAGRELRVRRDELHRLLEGGITEDRPTPEEDAAAILSRKHSR